MKEVKAITGDIEHYYLPHHAVLKDSSTTTKLRVVFDASAKTSTGISLNDIMLNGPTLQQDLLSILLRWRKHRYVYTADVEKMFRQILIHEDDQDYQRICWRKTPEQTIKEYKLTTVTYGTAAATYLAVRTLQQLARDEALIYPNASEVTLNDFYVDDLISGNNTLEEALVAQKQIIALLKTGGFNLRKWASNHSALIQAIPTGLRNNGIAEFKLDDTVKTLGLHWNPATDSFGFRISLLNSDKEPTKRSLLSDSAKLFDPLGWLAPVTVVAKLMMQELWITGLSWDQSLPPALSAQWLSFKNSLHLLEEITIPRWICFNTTTSISLHGFCDASEKAYAAVVYARSITPENKIKVTLLSAKTKVAPIKTICSLPRLELCGALLLTKLMGKVVDALQIPNIDTSFWTDSMITLSWIRGRPHKYKTFVANRISEIQEMSNPTQWRHINSKENPADCASRGVHPTDMKEHSLWWTGPEWLQATTQNWPQQTSRDENIDIELRQVFTVTNSTTSNPFGQLTETISDVNKICRIFSYCRRFIKRCLRAPQDNSAQGVVLTGKELQEARQELCRIIQQQEFQEEIRAIRKHGSVSTKSNILCLNPFIDEQGILRVGGRLRNSKLSFNARHPIMLPQKHALTKLLIAEAHLRTLHGGAQLTLAHLRRTYWFTNGKQRVRTEINKCVRCHRFRTTTKLQLMADLPKGRVVPSRPFTHTGVDFAGPIQVRVSKGRGTKSYKGYIAVFVCFSSKAIHLEIVSDQTAIAFVAAFKRFIARRGLCQHIYSDNGTNFIGARSILEKERLESIKQAIPQLQAMLAKDGTTWHFIPPSAPHFGGLWEAAVKSMKYHLNRTIGKSTLTYEELATVTAQIEAALNSRPLTVISADPNDMILTPGHFLVGDALIAAPEPSLLMENVTPLQRWKFVQKIVQDFWKGWSGDYLASLQRRGKWHHQQPEAKVGDVVLIRDSNLPPTSWSLGRIIKLHPGNDNLTRVVTVKNSSGTEVKRPISKIIPLPINDTEVAEHEPERQTPKRSAHTTSSIKCLPLFLLSLVAMSSAFGETAANSRSYNLTSFSHQPGLYFEHSGSVRFSNNQWKIIVYFNLTTYYAELNAYRSWTRSLEQLCINSTITDVCGAINAQLYHILTDIELKNEILHHNGKNTRQKRGAINIIGNIANELFGIMDSRDAEHYEEEIKKAKTNEEYLLKLIKNQTSISDATLNILKRSEAEIFQNWKIFKQQVQEQLNDLNNGNRLTALSMHTLLSMLNFKETQQTLIEAVLESHTKAVSANILKPAQLREQITKTAPHMPPGVMLPGHQNPDQVLILYQVMSCRGRLSGQNVIFELKVPLINSEKFQLFKPLSFPTPEATFIQPVMEYMATSLHRDQYYMMSKHEFHHCRFTDDCYICTLQHPIHSAYQNNSICELQLLTSALINDCQVLKRLSKNPQDTWIKLKNNNWIFSLHHEQVATIACEEDVSSVAVPMNGKISLREGCTLRVGSVTLKSHKVVNTRIDLSFLPAVNLSKGETPASSIQLYGPPSQTDFSALHKRLRELEDSNLPISYHDVHHYSMTYMLICVAIIFFIVYRCKVRPRPPQRGDYNLQNPEQSTAEEQV